MDKDDNMSHHTPFQNLSTADQQLTSQLLGQYNALRSEIVAYSTRQLNATRLSITALLTVTGLMLAAQKLGPSELTPELKELIRGVAASAAIAIVFVWVGVHNFATLLIHELGAYSRLIEQHLNRLWGQNLFVWDTTYINRLSGTFFRRTWWFRFLPTITQLFPIIFMSVICLPTAWKFLMATLQPLAAWVCVVTASALIVVNALVWPFIPYIVHSRADHVNQDLFHDVWRQM